MAAAACQVRRFGPLDLDPQPPHAHCVERYMDDERGNEAMRALIEIAHARGQERQRDPVRAVLPVQQGEDQRADDDRQPGGHADERIGPAGIDWPRLAGRDFAGLWRQAGRRRAGRRSDGCRVPPIRG